MGRDGERNPLGLGARGRGAGACCGREHGDAREDEEGGAPLRHAGANALGSVDSPWRVFGETGSGGTGD